MDRKEVDQLLPGAQFYTVIKEENVFNLVRSGERPSVGKPQAGHLEDLQGTRSKRASVCFHCFGSPSNSFFFLGTLELDNESLS